MSPGFTKFLLEHGKGRGTEYAGQTRPVLAGPTLHLAQNPAPQTLQTISIPIPEHEWVGAIQKCYSEIEMPG